MDDRILMSFNKIHQSDFHNCNDTDDSNHSNHSYDSDYSKDSNSYDNPTPR